MNSHLKCIPNLFSINSVFVETFLHPVQLAHTLTHSQISTPSTLVHLESNKMNRAIILPLCYRITGQRQRQMQRGSQVLGFIEESVDPSHLLAPQPPPPFPTFLFFPPLLPLLTGGHVPPITCNLISTCLLFLSYFPYRLLSLRFAFLVVISPFKFSYTSSSCFTIRNTMTAS